MNLIKNVTGSWDQAKQLVRQDLDTLQRTVNDIIAKINAPVPEVPIPPAVISSANTVTTFEGDSLTSVAVKPDSGLAGSGRITDPLYNTGIFSGVTVGAAGALTGDGTSGSALAVSVDGTTITINGSNQLALVNTPPELFATIALNYTGAGGGVTLNSAPYTLVAGVANYIIYPRWWSLYANKNAGSWIGSGATYSLKWGALTVAPNISTHPSGLGSALAMKTSSIDVQGNQATNDSAGGYAGVGEALIIKASGDITWDTPHVGQSVTLVFNVGYILLAG